MELREALRDLVKMWRVGEDRYIRNQYDEAKRDQKEFCCDELEEILDGDYSCIERIEE